MDILLIRWDELEEIAGELKSKTLYPGFQFLIEEIRGTKLDQRLNS